jgi:DNA polymerase IV
MILAPLWRGLPFWQVEPIGAPPNCFDAEEARVFRECHSIFEASPFRQPEGRGFFLQPKHVHSASLVSARMLARSGRTLLDSRKHLARPTTCLQIAERREKMNEVGAEPLIVMAEPEGFALAPRGSDLEVEQGSQRKIIHVDMDAFYASVEQRDNPALRGKPVAVGGSRARGVVAAASYEARKFGVRSAMPSVTARRKCPDLIFVEPRFDVYKKVSLQIRAIFAEHTAVIEPLSLDEAYLDVTENSQGIASAPDIAERIKAKIRAETQLTASAGVSYNKFLAKLASDHRKPDGLFVITPEMGPRFIEALAVERFHGVGPATAAKMKKLGIFTARDLRAKDEAFLLRYFGKAGRHFYWICRGIDRRPVLPNRIRKSIGAENTFSRDLTSLDDMRVELDPLVDKVWHYCESVGVRGRTVTLKVKFANFQIITRSRSYIAPISDRATLASISEELLAAQFPMRKGVRLLGVSLSSLCADAGDADPQMTLAL